MSGSTFVYENTLMLSVRFEFFLPESNNPNATVSFRNDSGTRVYNASFDAEAEKKSINFSLSENWSAQDSGFVTYNSVYSDCGSVHVTLSYQEDCRSITATTSESTVSRSSSESTDQSTVSTPQTTATSESPVSKTPSESTHQSAVSTQQTMGTSQSLSSTSPIITATESVISTTPATATSESTVSKTPSSGINVVANALEITFALVLSMVQ
ncbi:unnamed protein product [Calicophoron daubneyi]|uniref:Uncharacterized protein n=1 Tax=Calicophoron daubneyi TaxID=300641 RepID=A0AAV2T585_CALDB